MSPSVGAATCIRISAAPSFRKPLSTAPASRTRMPSRLPPAPRRRARSRRRALGLRAARGERQRQQQFVLDERQCIERRVGQHHFVLVVLVIDARELAFVAREQQERRLPTGHRNGCRQRWHVSGTRPGQRDLQRRASGGVGAARDPVVDVRRAGAPRRAGRPRAATPTASTCPAMTARCAATPNPSKRPCAFIGRRIACFRHPGASGTAGPGFVGRARSRCPRRNGGFPPPLRPSIKNVG